MTSYDDSQLDRLPRSFFFFNATQFFGALNDNLFRFLLILYLISALGKESSATIIAVAGVVFVLPFLLFNALAGIIADRVSKQKIIVTLKVTELLVMLTGLFSFYVGNAVLLYAIFFLMAAQSAFFGPCKYGIVPELVGKARLSRANGFLTAFTYLAIIIGTALAPALSILCKENYLLAGSGCIVIALLGLGASIGIPRTEAAGSTKRASVFFLKDIWFTLRFVRTDFYLLLAILGSAYFTLVASFVQMNLIPFGMQTLNLNHQYSTYLALIIAVGIGIGSILASRISHRNIEIGLIPVGAVIMTAVFIGFVAIPEQSGVVFPHIFSTFTWSVLLVLLLLVLAGLGAGFFIVPINAFIQFRSPRQKLGEILAAGSFLSWCGVLFSSALLFLFSTVFKLSAATGFLIIGCFTLVLTLAALVILPDFLLRFIFLVLTRIFYRIRMIGIDNVPLEGPAILVCNHVSLADAALLSATQQRRIRFMMSRRMYESSRLMRAGARLMQAIPISYSDPPRKIAESLIAARDALDDGYMICIFAEGTLSRSGQMMQFRHGFERIARGSNHPIIPVYLGGAWGSIFSYFYGNPMTHLPRMIPYPVTVIFGKPLPASSSAVDVRNAILELSCDYFEDRKSTRTPLSDMLVKSARQNWSRPCITDSSGKQLTFGEMLTGSVLMAKVLAEYFSDSRQAGILLPPSVGGALANTAAALMGKTAVNLNYTCSRDVLASTVAQCDFPRILTSKVFLNKLGIGELSKPPVFIEDLLKKITPTDKRRAWLKARFLPRSLLGSYKTCSPDDIAAIIFSSGSTGDPKGVMLSHHNISSNIESMRMIVNPTRKDCLCGILPFFHSFGYTVTLWVPLLSGYLAVYHYNPLDAGTIGGLVHKHHATQLLATPTFLVNFTRRISCEQFSSLKMVITGAEKLKPFVADAFERKFGMRPLEGYGATELSPVIAMNMPDITIDGLTQIGYKEGSAGQPLPGIAVKTINPDTGATTAPGEPGLILVKGPNVMQGYLNRPDLTAEVITDGWYNTGDIGFVDEDGFITITDRLSRFSKIGGEMVPHIAVEDMLHAGLHMDERVLAVTAVPDEQRDEKLVVLFTPEAGSGEHLKHIADTSGLPNLWKPASDAYARVDSLPVLGSGKLDLRSLHHIALDIFS